ncbi:MAG: hypothetical protein IPH75_14310 [bacterium]|nr:hypothetical protein [bacterium]
MTGYLASNFGRLSEEKSLDDFIDDYFLDYVGENRTLESKSLTADSTGRLVITFVYTVPEFARELDNNLVVKPVSYRFRENPFTREKRVYPIDFDFPYVYHNVVIIGSSRPMVTATLPQQVTSAAPGITYKRLAQFIDGKVQLDAKLTITNDLLEPDAYPEVKKLFEDVAHASQDEVILHMGAQ